jgi:hypothetical protein
LLAALVTVQLGRVELLGRLGDDGRDRSRVDPLVIFAILVLDRLWHDRRVVPLCLLLGLAWPIAHDEVPDHDGHDAENN